MLNKNWKPEVVIISMTVVQFEIKTLITVHRTPNVPKNVGNSFYESSKVYPTVGMLRSLQSHDLRFAPLPPSEDLCEETLKVLYTVSGFHHGFQQRRKFPKPSNG